MQQVNLGLIGGGTVGGGVYQAVQRNGLLMGSRLGVRLQIARIAVRNLRKRRAVKMPRALLTTDWLSVVNDPKIDLVLELMGGTTTAREVVLAALSRGKPVVTANKALLSAHGEELFAAAQNFGTNLYYEASVAGGIPIIKVLRESLVGNRITRLYAIVNGTCNYILTRMKLEGADFAEVLAEAQRLGYAEAEPSLDIDGHDAAHKIGILASLAHGFWVNPRQIYVEGIRHISRLDMQFADLLGYTIKLLGIVKANPAPPQHPKSKTQSAIQSKIQSAIQSKTQSAIQSKIQNPKSKIELSVQVSVYPTLIPNSHVLASVNGVYNAVSVRGDVVGDTLYYGRGAGQDATASAVLSDLADAALDLKTGAKSRIPPFVPHAQEGVVLPLDEVVSRYYVRLSVIDRPGTLAKIAAILARARIGISSVIQPEGHEGESVPLILMIHDATNAAMREALQRIRRLDVVRGKPILLRVEHFE